MLAPLSFLFASSLISSSLAATFTVKVGDGGLKFTPDFVRANQGDEILFEFYPKNHTLTQSTLANPCTPVDKGGDSGFMAVAPNAAQRPTKRLRVPDSTTPLWFYCKQGNHCGQGMVFAVNPKSDEQMATYRANALAFGTGAPPPASTQPPATQPPATTQTTPPTETTQPTTPPTGREIQVAVGQGGALTFTPESATAAVGDTLVFTFMAGAHTVTQSTFADPCLPLAGGVDSGPKPAAGLTSGFPNFTYTVTDASKPQWFYCKTGAHCKAGMVFSLNAPATGNTAEAFKAKAMGNAPPTTDSTTTGATPNQSQDPAGPGSGASGLAAGSFGFVVAAAIAGLLL